MGAVDGADCGIWEGISNGIGLRVLGVLCIAKEVGDGEWIQGCSQLDFIDQRREFAKGENIFKDGRSEGWLNEYR